MISALILLGTHAQGIEAVLLRDLCLEASITGRRVEASPEVSAEVVLRRTTKLNAFEQVLVIAECVGYSLSPTDGGYVLQKPKNTVSRLSIDYFGPLSGLVSKQSFDVSLLRPGQRVVFSSRPTQMQLGLRGSQSLTEWLSAYRGPYGIQLQLTDGSHQRILGGEPPLGAAKHSDDPEIALSQPAFKWVKGNLDRVNGRPTSTEPLLDQDPVTLLYRDLLGAKAGNRDILFLAKDLTLPGLFAIVQSGRVRPSEAWSKLHQMYGLKLSERNGMFVGVYESPGLALASVVPWLRTPSEWSPQALASVSIDRAAEMATSAVDKTVYASVVAANDTNGISSLRTSSWEALAWWHALSAEQRLAARRSGTLLITIENGGLRNVVWETLMRRTVQPGRSSRPKGWSLGDEVWDEITYRLPNGLPPGSELLVDSRMVPCFVIERNGLLSLLTEKDLIHDLVRQMKKNPGGEKVQPSFRSCAPTEVESITMTVRVGELLEQTYTALGSVSTDDLRFVSSDQLDPQVMSRAMASARRLASGGKPN